MAKKVPKHRSITDRGLPLDSTASDELKKKENKAETMEKNVFPEFGEDFDIDLLLNAKSEIIDIRHSQQRTPVMLDSLDADNSLLDASISGLNESPKRKATLPFQFRPPCSIQDDSDSWNESFDFDNSSKTQPGSPKVSGNFQVVETPDRFLSRTTATDLLVVPEKSDSIDLSDSVNSVDREAALFDVDMLLADYISDSPKSEPTSRPKSDRFSSSQSRPSSRPKSDRFSSSQSRPSSESQSDLFSGLGVRPISGSQQDPFYRSNFDSSFGDDFSPEVTSLLQGFIDNDEEE